MNENASPSRATTEEKKVSPKRGKRVLKVAFDTSVLFAGSASDLVRQEIADLINESLFPDLEVQWYLPEIVRHERQYQMQAQAFELLPSIAKLERLLGHNLNITKEILTDRVEKVICQREKELGLRRLELDTAGVNWSKLMLNAAYRHPPFQPGKSEKGFRDALVVESFLQLVQASPKTPAACMVALVTGDSLLTDAVQQSVGPASNVRFLSGIEDLRGLINTLASQVDETFISKLKPKAKILFFEKENKNTFFYKAKLRHRISEEFEQKLKALPPGATERRNGTWLVSAPHFVRKEGQRVIWSTRISVEAEAYWEPEESQGGFESLRRHLVSPMNLQDALAKPGQSAGLGAVPLRSLLSSRIVYPPSAPKVMTHKGTDVYEVIWSTQITMSIELRRPEVLELKHIECRWESAA